MIACMIFGCRSMSLCISLIGRVSQVCSTAFRHICIVRLFFALIMFLPYVQSNVFSRPSWMANTVWSDKYIKWNMRVAHFEKCICGFHKNEVHSSLIARREVVAFSAPKIPTTQIMWFLPVKQNRKLSKFCSNCFKWVSNHVESICQIIALYQMQYCDDGCI